MQSNEKPIEKVEHFPTVNDPEINILGFGRKKRKKKTNGGKQH